MNKLTKAELINLKELFNSIQERRNLCDKEALRLLTDCNESKDFSEEKFDAIIIALREIDMVLAVTAYRQYHQCNALTAFKVVKSCKVTNIQIEIDSETAQAILGNKSGNRPINPEKK